MARLMAREGISEQYAASRVAAQKSNGYFSGLCEYTLENDSDLDAFATKCLDFFMELAIIKEEQ